MRKKNFSEWQRNLNSKYPLLCQIITRVIAGLIVAGIVVTWVPPQPKARAKKVSKSSSEVTIWNEGIIPANTYYSVVSDDSVITSVNVKDGKENILIENTSDEKVKIFKIINLPKNKEIKVDVATDDTLTLIEISPTDIFKEKMNE